MCGITGFIDFNSQFNDHEMATIVTRMADTLSHRGPDDSGYWIEPTARVAMGFRRLAILDLTPSGAQPMISQNQRYVMVYNGEVYNFTEIKNELAQRGCRFRGASDTEVLLEAISEWGLDSALARFNGMFAFAVWDRQERCLTLVRDRIGVKPLYYGWSGGTFYFASELKALRAHPAFKGTIYRDALALYMRHNYVPTPHSIYQDTFKLVPGTKLTVSFADSSNAQPVTYWSLSDAAGRGISQPFDGSDAEATVELDTLLRASIRQRMIADVPLGAFLSGGVDSSTIVALMQAQSTVPVHTFTIGFHEARYNEAEYAQKVATHLGTDHITHYVTPDEARSVIPLLPALYDEPFSDSSQIPTYLVSKLARRKVTVALSGDGGDELFGGYERYARATRVWNRYRMLPGWGRKLARTMVGTLTPEQWQALSARVLPNGKRRQPVDDKVSKLTDLLRMHDPQQLYRRLVSHWERPSSVVLHASEAPTLWTERAAWSEHPDFMDWMMYTDMVTYLPDDILTKVDRASMGVSLEARTPLVDDHRLVEKSWHLPLSMKIRAGTSKWLLRQVLYQYVPRAMIERPKRGFSVPIDRWLRGPLREWAETLLNENRLRQEGYFNPTPIRRMWDEHLQGKYDRQYHLWDVLMFQAWLEAQAQPAPAAG